jgi:hypothetical protein
MSLKEHGGIILTRNSPDSSTRALWQSYQRPSNSKAGGTGELIWPYEVSLFILRRVVYGADGFTSYPKESVLRILVALKNPLPSAGFKHGRHRGDENLFIYLLICCLFNDPI